MPWKTAFGNSALDLALIFLHLGEKNGASSGARLSSTRAARSAPQAKSRTKGNIQIGWSLNATARRTAQAQSYRRNLSEDTLTCGSLTQRVHTVRSSFQFPLTPSFTRRARLYVPLPCGVASRVLHIHRQHRARLCALQGALLYRRHYVVDGFTASAIFSHHEGVASPVRSHRRAKLGAQ